MKIRAGFVSNSSSSSFTTVGVCIDRDDLKSMEDGFRKILSLPEDSDLLIEEMVERLGGRNMKYEGLRLDYVEGDRYHILGIRVSYGDTIRKTPICEIVDNAQSISQFLQDFERLCGLPSRIEKTPSLFSGLLYC